jgi:transposase
MYLGKFNKPDGRIYLSICKQYRDPVTKQRRTRTVESIGYVDELEKQFPDPIAHFTEVAEAMTDEESSASKITLDMNEKLPVDTDLEKNYGYIVLSRFYHALSIDLFFQSRQRKYDVEYNLNSIFKLLVYERILDPGSKLKAYQNKDKYFDLSSFSLNDLYRSLSKFINHKDELQLWIHERIQKKYKRKTKLTYYDVTNYYFEIDNEDDLRKDGYSKENKKSPIVQMGLLTDVQGIPINYQLFEGNTHDSLTLRDMISNVIVKNDYKLGRIIVVADKGIHSGDNIYYLKSAKHGYIFSSSVKKSSVSFKNYVLNEKGYKQLSSNKENPDSYKYKSRLTPRTISVTGTDGKKIKKTIDEKQVIFYSEKYAKRSKAKRDELIEKAYKIINNPSAYNKASTSGARKYIKDIKFDKDTGEILESESILTFDREKLEEDEKYDGYYAIFTSEMDMPDEKVISTYKGLWIIEETFKITKSDLETIPVYLTRSERIESHFLTCYVALVILRLIQFEMDNDCSIEEIISSLKKCACTNLSENKYVFKYYNSVLEKLGKKFDIEFDNKFLTKQQIIKNISKTKKR